MEFAYFPGCAGHSTARDQDLSTRELLKALQVDLEELEAWHCCGATPGHTIGGSLSLLLSLKNLSIAVDTSQDLLVPCASCFGNLKAAEQVIKRGEVPQAIKETDPGFTLPPRAPRVVSVVTLLSDAQLIKKIEKSVKMDLSAINVAPYYGCLLLRPQEVTGAPNIEIPVDMENIIEACGAKAVQWPHKTDCCGGPHTVSHPEMVSTLSGRLVDKARSFGADAIVTACPMCHAGLDTTQWERARRGQTTAVSPLPVLYLTELVAAALDVKRQSRWLKRHLIDPRPLLREKVHRRAQ